MGHTDRCRCCFFLLFATDSKRPGPVGRAVGRSSSVCRSLIVSSTMTWSRPSRSLHNCFPVKSKPFKAVIKTSGSAKMAAIVSRSISWLRCTLFDGQKKNPICSFLLMPSVLSNKYSKAVVFLWFMLLGNQLWMSRESS